MTAASGARSDAITVTIPAEAIPAANGLPVTIIGRPGALDGPGPDDRPARAALACAVLHSHAQGRQAAAGSQGSAA